MTTAAPGARRLPTALDGWAADDHEQALSAYLKTAPAGWPVPAVDQSAATFFETAFTFDPAVDGAGLCTAYFEPELEGAMSRFGPYQYPLYRLPPDLPGGRRYHDRAAIDAGAMEGKGLELVWLKDPVEAFFLHIQGSGRIVLPDGAVFRVGYAGKNGHAYRSIGAILVDRGVMTLESVTAEGIKHWLRDNPADGRALMAQNASYVFFGDRPGLNTEDGPIGTAQVPLTALRSVAVDPAFHPLGSLLWLWAPDVPEAHNRLMVAQDTGGAIKGPNRLDIFLGSGAAAGHRAGEVRANIQVTTLSPNVGVAR